MTDDMSVRVTRDLCAEIARLTGSNEPRRTAPESAFPGIVLSSGDSPCAAIGFAVEPGAVLAITVPVFLGDAAPEIRVSGMRRLLQEVHSEAARRSCRMIRFVQSLQTSGEADWLNRLMEDAGYAVRARIAQWEKTTATPADVETERVKTLLEDAEVSFVSFTSDLLRADTTSQHLVRNLLRRILSDSHDLINLPSPDADELLRDWIEKNAAVFVGNRLVQPVALCVCIPEGSFTGSILSAWQIHYIGVIPTERGKGIASRLIDQLPSQLSAVSAISTLQGEMRFTVFSDTANQPATRLYHRCGFQSRGQFDVWCCSAVRNTRQFD